MQQGDLACPGSNAGHTHLHRHSHTHTRTHIHCKTLGCINKCVCVCAAHVRTHTHVHSHTQVWIVRIYAHIDTHRYAHCPQCLQPKQQQKKTNHTLALTLIITHMYMMHWCIQTSIHICNIFVNACTQIDEQIHTINTQTFYVQVLALLYACVCLHVFLLQVHALQSSSSKWVHAMKTE